MSGRVRDHRAAGGLGAAAGRCVRRAVAAALVLAAIGCGAGLAMAEEPDGIAALRSAAAEGEPAALFELADRHERGDGVAHDLALAAAYLRLAAERGHPEARYRLGLLYAGGLGGVPEDPVEGYKWLSLAVAADGDGTAGLLAAGLREALGATMTPEEIGRGEELAAAFSPVEGPPAELPAPPEDEAVPDVEPALAALEAYLKETTCDGLTPSLCRVVNLLREHAAEFDRGMSVVVRDAEGTARDVFEDGDYLVVELPALDEERHVAVDYFVHDGGVLHMHPDRGVPAGPLPAGQPLVLGDPSTGGQTWRVGPPFGRDLLAVFVSDRPLYRAPRPQFEPSADYLDFLRGRLGGAGPGDDVLFHYRVLTTVPEGQGAVASGGPGG